MPFASSKMSKHSSKSLSMSSRSDATTSKTVGMFPPAFVENAPSASTSVKRHFGTNEFHSQPCKLLFYVLCARFDRRTPTRYIDFVAQRVAPQIVAYQNRQFGKVQLSRILEHLEFIFCYFYHVQRFFRCTFIRFLIASCKVRLRWTDSATFWAESSRFLHRRGFRFVIMHIHLFKFLIRINFQRWPHFLTLCRDKISAHALAIKLAKSSALNFSSHPSSSRRLIKYSNTPYSCRFSAKRLFALFHLQSPQLLLRGVGKNFFYTE